MIGGKDIIQLNSNFIPKGLIPLEKLFDRNDVAKNPKVQPQEDESHDHNIGTKDQPKIVKLSKALPIEEKSKYVEIMKKNSDVFAWSYEDLKEYDTSTIQRTIPIKLGEKTFKKKSEG